MRFLHSPVFYLVGSNLLFWGVPLALIHFRSPRLAELPLAQALNPDLAQASVPPPVLDLDLDAAAAAPSGSAAEPSPVVDTPVAVVQAVPPPLERPELLTSAPLPSEPPQALTQELKGAAGLGGPITLQSLKEPLMPIAARVERQQQQRSGDALAALPRHWREALREELPAAKPVSVAAVVRLPVPELKQRQEVPVIVNERGEGEALVAPENQRVRQAVEGWAARQAPSSPGTVQVYVVAAEPIKADGS